MNHPRFLFSAVFALGVLAACGGGAPAATVHPNATPAPAGATATPAPVPTQGAVTTPAPVGGDVNVCSLLTAGEISAATGKTYAEGKPDEVGQCLWNLVGVNVNQGDLIVGYMQTAIDLNFIKSSFGQGGSDTTINGHAAFWNPTQGLGSMWVDVGGGRLFILSFPRSEDLDESYLQIATTLAGAAVSRL